MLIEFIDKFSLNIDRMMGFSICFVSDDIYLNKKAVDCILEKLPNFNKLDLLRIKPDKGNIKIDNIREIQEFFSYRPNFSNKKIVVIEEVDKLQIESANALLKVLEEPPEFGIIIGFTNRWNSLLPTIRSRFYKYNIPHPDELYVQIPSKLNKFPQFINIIKNSEYDIIEYVLNLNDEEIEDLFSYFSIDINNIIEAPLTKPDLSDFDFFIDCLKNPLDTPHNRLLFILAYFQIFKKIICLNQKDFFNIVERIASIKREVESMEFLKLLSKSGSIILRDVLVSKTSDEWKYLINTDLISFLGLDDYSFNIEMSNDTLDYFNGIINSKLSNFNFEMEIYTHYLRMERCYN